MHDRFRSLLILVCMFSLASANGALVQEAQAKSKPASEDPNSTPKPAPAGPLLTLDSYLHQVTDQHEGYRAAMSSTQAARGEAEEGGLLVKPNLIGGAVSSISGQSDPLSSDPKNFRTRIYNLGVQETTPYGLSGKVTYNHSEILFPGFVPNSYDSNWGQAELTLPLWRNLFGAETRAQEEASKSAALARAFSQSYVTKTLLLEAETAYWHLQLARELVAIERDGVDRAKRLTDWASRRSRLQLSDRAEYLQTSTAYEARKIELTTALDNEQTAARAFNSSRGVNSDIVPETLADISVDLTATMKSPERMHTRDDVKAAELQAKASSASARAARERNKPTLEAYGTVLLNEPDKPPGTLAIYLASSEPATAIGVRLNAPLDFMASSKVREGYAAEASANDAAYHRKVFEEERDWADLAAKFAQAQQRLKMYADLEKIQRDKLLYERNRQQLGRSTLEQVLIYEGDYEQAQLGRINTLADLLTLNAQMKLYGVSYESR